MKNKNNEQGAALIFAFILLSLSLIISTTLITENLATKTSFENIQSETASFIYAETASKFAIKQFKADNNYAGTPDNANNTWFSFGTEGGKIIIKKISEIAKGKKKTVTYHCMGKAPNAQSSTIEIVLED